MLAFATWIDALAFKSHGGWHVETQFVREMGQGYLYALNLPGLPPEDAVTTVTVPKAGMYRVWVRTRNWLRDYAPGRFVILANGKRIGNELGCLPSDEWTWEIAGDAALEQGEHELSARDTTGYFPRFAALIVTDDMDYTPSPEWPRMERERARLMGGTFAIADGGSYDVAVVGAGPGGIPAAIAAARKGLKVALIHSRPVLGGNASNEGTVGFDGAYIHHPGFRESGIAEEIRRVRDHEKTSWEGALTKLCRAEPNLCIFLNQCVVDTEMEGDTITSAFARDTLLGGTTRFRAKMFIDATGDGWLGYYAGAAYRAGREAKWQHGEGKALDNADTRTMSGCLMGTYKGQQMLSYFAEDMGHPVPFCAPKWAQILPDALHRAPHRLHTGEWWIENPTDFDDLFEAERVRDELLRISLAYFHWLKNQYPKRELMANYAITALPAYDAKRESRRLIGDYVLTQEDCTSGRKFDDIVAYAGWTIDVHNPQGIFSGKEGPYDFDIRVPLNGVPYRCLYSKNVRNLLMSGRCISVTHIAMGTIRVENTLATIGQAVGTAAAMAIALGVTPREIGRRYIKELQQTLLRDDAFIPGLSNMDATDLALTAKAEASSVCTTERFSFARGCLGEWQPLDRPFCMSMMKAFVSAPLSIHLKNNGDAAEITAEWVAVIGNQDNQSVREAHVLRIAKDFDGFVDIPLAAEIETPVIGLRFSVAKDVCARRVEMAQHGWSLCEYKAPYWPLVRNTTFEHRMYGETEAPLADCGPMSVINGHARPMDETRYAWVSDPSQPMPQTITLTLDKASDIRRVQLVFDTDLVNPLYSAQSIPVVGKTVKDYEIWVETNGVYMQAAKVAGNYMRFCVHDIAATAVTAVRVTVLATWGDPSARVFEVRIY